MGSEEEDDFGDSFDEAELDDMELDEDDLAELQAFEDQLEDVDAEDLEDLDLEKSANVFLNALKPRSPESVLQELEAEMEREAEEAKKRSLLKTCRPGAVPKYLVNPFALPDRTEYEEVFGDIDSEEPQLRIWRIEAFSPVEIPEDQWGKFYTKDCYIILYITDQDEQLVIHIHHWIGLQAAPDKYGAAAFRAVELNTYLGGGCRIYREMEATESKTMLAYFGDDVEYLFGGTKSCFRHVEVDKPKEYATRMYRIVRNPSCKGYCMRLLQLSQKHLVTDRVILLDCGLRIFLWFGRQSTYKMRHEALEYATAMRAEERSNAAIIVPVLDGDEDFDYRYDIEYFWKQMGGRVEPTQPQERRVAKRFMFIAEAQSMAVLGSWDNFVAPVPMVQVGADEWDVDVTLAPGEYVYQYKKVTAEGSEVLCDDVREQREMAGKTYNVVTAEPPEEEDKFTLFQTYEKEDGRMNLEGLDYGDSLTSEVLSTRHSYIFDCKNELFVWFGLKCNPLEKQVAVALADKFLEFERPEWTPIILMQETAETASFRSKFSAWTHKKRDPRTLPAPKENLAVTFDLASVVNVESQLRVTPEEEEVSIVDNSHGTTDVYVTGDGAAFEKVPARQRGIFYSASSYVVVYKYTAPGARFMSYLVYFWSGIESNANKDFSHFVLDFLSILTRRVGGDRVNAVRVRQGKEPADFMRLFGYSMAVRQGSFSTWSRYTTKETRLFDVACVRAQKTMQARALEVEAVAASLSTRRCFILRRPLELMVWLGRHTSDEERSMALGIAAHMRKADKTNKPTVAYFEEERSGDMLEDFLRHLEAPEHEASDVAVVPARAYCCSLSRGLLEINELVQFAQYDLQLRVADVVLVHTEKKLYLWVGGAASTSLHVQAQQVCDIWRKYTEEQGKAQELVEVTSGEEPADFKALFHAWSSRAFAFDDALGRSHAAHMAACEKAVADERDMRRVHARVTSRIELLEQVASNVRFDAEEEKLVRKAAHMLKIDWEEVWRRDGVLPPKVEEKESALAAYKQTVTEEDTLFLWEDSEALAVNVVGSWNDFEPTPLVQLGGEGFCLKMELPVGRHYFHYLVATADGVTQKTVDTYPCLPVKSRGGDMYNILRIYACDTAVEEEEEEEEEEDLTKLTVEQLQEKEKQWREEQRVQREQRLQRQLEQQREAVKARAARRSQDASERSPRTSSPKSRRRSRMATEGSSPLRSSRGGSSSNVYMESLLGSLGSSPSRATGRATSRSSTGKAELAGLFPRKSSKKAAAAGSAPSVRTKAPRATRKARKSLESSLSSEKLTSAAGLPKSRSGPAVTSLPPRTAPINTSLEALAIIDSAATAAKSKVAERDVKRSRNLVAQSSRENVRNTGETGGRSSRRSEGEDVVERRTKASTRRSAERTTSSETEEESKSDDREARRRARREREKARQAEEEEAARKKEARRAERAAARKAAAAEEAKAEEAAAAEREARRKERRRQLGLE